MSLYNQPQQQKDVSAELGLAEKYTHLYKRMKHDSPDRSRTDLVREIVQYLHRTGDKDLKLLSVGSGPQALEKQLLCSINQQNLPCPTLHTCDLADIPVYRLLCRGSSRIHHVQLDANTLAFGSEAFDLVYSNLAIDFAGPKAFVELARVLKTGGTFILNLHHPEMIPADMSHMQQEPGVCEVWNYLLENEVLFATVEQIHSCLSRLGLDVEHISREQSGKDVWWHVVGGKPREC